MMVSDVERLFEVRSRWHRLFTRLVRFVSFTPRVEVVELDEGHVLLVDLPGVGREDVDIRVDAHHLLLTIAGERRQTTMRRPRARHYSERRYGAFSRTIELPRDADPSRMETELHDGVLEIRVPKLETSRTRIVPIGGRAGGRDATHAEAARFPSTTVGGPS